MPANPTLAEVSALLAAGEALPLQGGVQLQRGASAIGRLCAASEYSELQNESSQSRGLRGCQKFIRGEQTH